MTLLRVVLACLLGLLVAAVPAQSLRGRSEAWLATATLSGPGARDPVVAVDPRGDVTVVWATKDGSEQGVIKAAYRPAGGRFARPRTVSPRGVTAYGPPDLGVDKAGNATLVWSRPVDAKSVVNAATLRQGRRVGAVQRIGGPDTLSGRVQVAVNAHGDAVAAWLTSDEPPSSSAIHSWVLRTAFRHAGGRFGSAQTVVSPPAGVQSPQFEVSIDAQGDALLAWVVSDPSQSTVHAAYRPADGVFGPAETLADGANVDGGMDARGDAVVTWVGAGKVEAALRPAASGAWEPSRNQGETGTFGAGPSLAVGADGSAIAAWTTCCPLGKLPVEVRSLPSGAQNWVTEPNLSPPDTRPFNLAPSVAIGARGDAIVAWSLIADQATIVAAVRPPGAGFVPAETVWQGNGWASTRPALAVDAQGNAVAVWLTARSPLPRDEPFEVVHAAGYDAAGPQLRSLRMPGSARAGTAVHFSVSPVDVWTRISSTSWSFGDGASATGGRVSHRYRTVGSYTVTVTSTDTLGHATVTRRTLSVTAS